jgi:ribosome recycling factor
MKSKDTYKEPIILDFDGARVRVFRPELTESERNRRMKIIHKAAADLLLSVEAVR